MKDMNESQNSKSTLLIDANYLCHWAKYSRMNMILRGRPDALISAFFLKVIEISKTVKPNKLAFAWDSGNSKRAKIYPEYKENRKDRYQSPRDKALARLSYPEFNRIREEFLPIAGIRNSYKVDGYEGDDIIAAISIDSSKTESVCIVSSDNDLFQLLNNGCYMLNAATGAIRSNLWFEKTYGIPPSDWVKVKSLAGCSGDNVKGIEGIGEKRAIAYINGELKKTSKFYSKIENSWDIVKRNVELVALPFKGTPFFKPVEENLKLKDFADAAVKTGATDLLGNGTMQNWETLFCKE